MAPGHCAAGPAHEATTAPSDSPPRLEGAEAEAGLELMDHLDALRAELMCAVDQVRGAGEKRDALDSLHEATMTLELAGCTLRRMLGSLAGLDDQHAGRVTRTAIARALGPIVDAWGAELMTPRPR